MKPNNKLTHYKAFIGSETYIGKFNKCPEPSAKKQSLQYKKHSMPTYVHI